MADIPLQTGVAVKPVFVENSEIYTVIVGVAMTSGQAAYFIVASGLAGIADANDSGKEQFRGILMGSGGVSQAVSLLKRGFLYGFDLTSQSIDDQLFLSDTAGLLADAAGTMTVPVGRVALLPDGLTKCAYIDADWVTQWS